MKLNNLIILLTLSLFTFLSCKDKEREMEEVQPEEQVETFEEDLQEMRTEEGIVVDIEGSPELSTFSEGLNAWNIGEELTSSKGPFTVFAPTNVAYSTMYRDQGREVLNVNNDAIIEYHIVKGERTLDLLREEAQKANDGLQLTTLNGEKLTVKLEGEEVVLVDSNGDKATITGSAPTESGVIHKIDKVLLPTNLEVEITTEN